MNYKIVVDAGHGGVDSGAVNGNRKEKDYNLEAANYMYKRFKELGVPVNITRSDDTSLTRKERIDSMKSFGNGTNVIVLSNHINAGGGEGAEVVYPLRNDSRLSDMILDEIGNRGQIKRKTYQRTLPENKNLDYYYIMRDTPNIQTLLIEYGFIDNKNDQTKLDNNLLNYVEGVVKAVSEYINIPYYNNSIDEGSYIVKQGDTLYSIARQFNTSVIELSNINNLNTDLLSVGQVLKINNINNNDNNINNNINNNVNKNSYIVKLGDTLYSISKLYNISINELIDFNNLESTLLNIGQELLIPNNTYIVKYGDTLYSISNKYNISVDELKKYNNLNSDILSINQVINIPTNNISNDSNYDNNNEIIVYEIKQGDTLYSIALRYNSNIDDIKKINNLDSSILSIGNVLQIPVNK